jgi:sporulation protein YqfC
MNPSKRNAAGEPRPSLLERLAVQFDVPADILDGGIRLDMRGRNTLTVHGCTRILDFSPCEIRLSLRDCILIVVGERLICTSYLAGAVGIEGLIHSVCFGDGEERL